LRIQGGERASPYEISLEAEQIVFADHQLSPLGLANDGGGGPNV